MMRNVLGIAVVAALASACGRGDQNSSQATNAAATDTAQSAPAATGTSGTTETITLTGCLARSSGNQVVGTSGRTAPARTDASAAPASDADRFILVNAKAGAPDATGTPTGASGVGTNGAGASGGPLVTGVESYVLEGNDLTEHEHQLVRVTGRFPDPLAGGVLNGKAAPTPAQDATTPNATAAPVPNAAARARGNANANDVAHMRHVQVESVTMIAANCSAK